MKKEVSAKKQNQKYKDTGKKKSDWLSANWHQQGRIERQHLGPYRPIEMECIFTHSEEKQFC